MEEEFDDFLGPNLQYVHQHKVQHKELLELIDLRMLELFNDKADKYDKARIQCLSNNGATSWLDVVPNDYYGVKYDNQEMWVLLSLFFGCNIINIDKLCHKCGNKMDKRGYHSLQCAKGKHQIQRHNSIRDEVNKLLRQAQYNTKIEQKYKYSADNGQIIINNKIPGDILAYRYDQGNDYYFDAVVGNIFATSYINNTSKESNRLWLAKKKENDKMSKHEHVIHFIPLAIEVMGGLGDKFKYVLQNMAHKIGTMKKIKYQVMMNRIRKKIIAILMKQNAKMIISSMLIS